MTGPIQLVAETPQHADIVTSKRVVTARARILVRWNEEGATVQSEASPLSGFGDDDFDTAWRELASLESAVVRDAVSDVASTFARWKGDQDTGRKGESPIARVGRTSGFLRSPSARFAFEALVLRLVARNEHVPLVRLLCRSPVATTLSTSAVLDPSSARTWDQAVELVKEGVRTFKVKAGRNTDLEVDLLRRLTTLSARIELRVDANGGWSPAETLRFVGLTRDLPIQWYEDPTPRVSEWTSLGLDESVLPFAVDEPLAEGQHLELSRLRAVILKPMALGGFFACENWAHQAERAGAKVCLSHFFDGPVALESYVALAFALQSKDVATGLGHHAGLGPFAEVEGLGVASLSLPGAWEPRTV